MISSFCPPVFEWWLKLVIVAEKICQFSVVDTRFWADLQECAFMGVIWVFQILFVLLFVLFFRFLFMQMFLFCFSFYNCKYITFPRFLTSFTFISTQGVKHLPNFLNKLIWAQVDRFEGSIPLADITRNG